MTIHLIQRVALVPNGMGRSIWERSLRDDLGYFTDPETAQPVLDRLNVHGRAEFEKQESLRTAVARLRGVDVTDSSIEAYPHIPRFVLISIDPGPSGAAGYLAQPDDGLFISSS